MNSLSPKTYPLSPKKSLGQNFLQDESVIERILETAEINPEDLVFEIGPGLGALTTRLKERAKKVVAIELDHELVLRLQKNFSESGNVSILEGNVLDVDLNELLEHADFHSGEYKIVANIPYYITAPILRTLLALRVTPRLLVLMVQKEVAERMMAPPGAMSLLSILTQYYADASIAFRVPPESFEPMPAVESAVVKLVPKRAYDETEDRKLFRVARAGFAARRKTLANNLSTSFHLPREKVEQILEALTLRKDIRAQALTLSDWERLRDALETAD